MIPTITDLRVPILKLLSDGNVRAFRPLLQELQRSAVLSVADLKKRSPTNGRTVLSVRVSYALQRLILEGTIENPKRSYYAISENGRRSLKAASPKPSPRRDLEVELEKELLRVYSRAGAEVGYWANYFLRSIRKRGGLAVAKTLLQPSPKISKGFQALLDAGRADLSMEAVTIRPKFAPLFTPAENAEARRRLSLFPKGGRRVVPAEQVYPETLAPDRQYAEGAVIRVIVNAYERNPGARRDCLRRYGYRCQVCDLSFEERYGDRGRQFIHVHHKKPLAASRTGYMVDPVKDLVPVCPNCHAMLHTVDPPLSIEELRGEMNKPKRKDTAV